MKVSFTSSHAMNESQPFYSRLSLIGFFFCRSFLQNTFELAIAFNLKNDPIFMRLSKWIFIPTGGISPVLPEQLPQASNVFIISFLFRITHIKDRPGLTANRIVFLKMLFHAVDRILSGFFREALNDCINTVISAIPITAADVIKKISTVILIL